ncbi:DUF397 domain-containing protein [Actinomadura scrupuli]
MEVAHVLGNIGIRDSKNPGLGHLTLRPDRFSALLHRIKNDHL